MLRTVPLLILTLIQSVREMWLVYAMIPSLRITTAIIEEFVFLASFLENRNIAVRVFDILRSGSRGTSLQVNVLGVYPSVRNGGFVGLLACGGHMRWLKSDGETPPAARRDWMQAMGDFVTVFNWANIHELLDSNKTDYDNPARLTCRLCRKKEKSLVAPVTFSNAWKVASTYPASLVLEGHTTGDTLELIWWFSGHRMLSSLSWTAIGGILLNRA